MPHPLATAMPAARSLVLLCLVLASLASAMASTPEPAAGALDPLPATTVPQAVDDPQGWSLLGQAPLAAYAGDLARVAQMPRSRLRGAHEQQLYARSAGSVVLISTERGSGAGALLTASGLIVTNWHVVRGSSEVAVMFKPASPGSAPALDKGRIVRVDEVADLALLQVAQVPAGVAPLPLGHESSLGIGADVHAIGHPGGLVWTYTRGIVSQIRPDYRWTSESKLAHQARVIQTQTPINPGNSGGPLLSDSGAVIGLNSFKLPEAEGLNFAVSVEEIRRFLATPGNRLATTDRTPDAGRASGGCRPGQMNQIAAGRGTGNDAQVTGFDTDCDGKVDLQLRQPDDPRRPIELVADRNGDGRIDLRVLDIDRDQRWDVSFVDADYDGQWDLVGSHPDGKVVASRYERYADYLRRMAAR